MCPLSSYKFNGYNEINKKFRKAIHYPMEMFEKYRKNNNITNSHDLYLSFRYPYIRNKNKKEKDEEQKNNYIEINYYDLKYNNKEAIPQLKKICAIADEILKDTLNLYHKNINALKN